MYSWQLSDCSPANPAWLVIRLLIDDQTSKQAGTTPSQSAMLAQITAGQSNLLQLIKYYISCRLTEHSVSAIGLLWVHTTVALEDRPQGL